MKLAEQVKQSLSALNCPLLSRESDIQTRVIQYLLLIEKWNKHFNLTAVRTIEAMLYQHVMDCLAIIAHLHGPHIVDVGTGAGLPGIPIAITRPDWHVTLIESNQKKTAFLQQVKIELNLENITIMPQRIENTVIEEKIDTIVSRAFASLGLFINTTRHLITPDNDQCQWVAMKSNCKDKELEEVSAPYYVQDKIPLFVPGLSANRELIIIRQSTTSIEPGWEKRV